MKLNFMISTKQATMIMCVRFAIALCIATCLAPVVQAGIVITPTADVFNNINGTTSTVTLTFRGRSDSATPVGTFPIIGDLVAGFGFTYNLPSAGTLPTALNWTRNSVSGNLEGFDLPAGSPASQVTLSLNSVSFGASKASYFTNDDQLVVDTTSRIIGTVQFTVNRLAVDQTLNVTGGASAVPGGGIGGTGFVLYNTTTLMVNTLSSTFNPVSFNIDALNVTAVPEPASLSLCSLMAVVLGIRLAGSRRRSISSSGVEHRTST